MRKSKSNYRNHEGNVFLGSIYLIVTVLLILSIVFNATFLLTINKFLGFGIYPLILFFVGLVLKNFNLYSDLSSIHNKLAQLILVIILAALGYSFAPAECLVNVYGNIKLPCTLQYLSGFKIYDALGSEASRIFLIVITLILIPVAFNISFDKIHSILNFFLSFFQLIVNYIGFFIAFIVDKLSDLFFYLEEKRKIAKEQQKINSQNSKFNDDDFEDDNTHNWVNPNIRKNSTMEIEDLEDELGEGIVSASKKTQSLLQKSKVFAKKQAELTDEEMNFEEDPIKSQTGAEKEVNIITNNHTDTDISDAIVSVDGLEYPDWQLPSLKLLDRYENVKVDKSDIRSNIERIERTYESFNMKVEVVNAVIGPTVTQYQMNIATGVSVRAILTRQPDVALALGVNGIRIEPIPGQSLIGLEVPNRIKITVKISEIMEELRKKYMDMRLGCVIGKSIDNKPILMDLQKMPHLLIAGTTGSGKSVLTNSLIISLLMTKSPDELKLILVDPKKVEFSDYNNIPHLLTPVIVENEKVMNAIKWLVDEMEKRYSILSNYKVRNIEGYNEKVGFTAMPYIVIVIDEVADLMSAIGKAFEAEVLRIAQKARATGIHLVLATQRPSVDVITGVLKGNIPGRIALKVASQQDSRVIIDRNGAESLVGYGDMLYGDPGKPNPSRIQGVWVDQKEVQRVVDFIISQVPEEEIGKNYKETIVAERNNPDDDANLNLTTNGLSEEDSTLNEALKVILQSNRFSTSLLQTYLKIGFNKASRMKMELENQGFIVPSTTKTGAFEINRDKIIQKLNGPTNQNEAQQEESEESEDELI